MNKMTVIQLLNKIANGEEVPQKVLYDENEYSFVRRNRLFAKYIREPFDARVPYYLFTDVWSVYDEVEILEEPKGIPEKLSFVLHGDDIAEIPSNELLMNKINEILDYLESKGE